jgi:hypothetical protein
LVDRCRICIISALRIQSIADLGFTNFSYSVVKEGVYSVLKPCLGVMNACLGVMNACLPVQPVASKMAQSRIFSSLRSSLRGTSYGSIIKKGDPESEIVTIGGSGQKKRYQKFDEGNDSVATHDEYPLNNMSVSGVKSNFRTDERW